MQAALPQNIRQGPVHAGAVARSVRAARTTIVVRAEGAPDAAKAALLAKIARAKQYKDAVSAGDVAPTLPPVPQPAASPSSGDRLSASTSQPSSQSDSHRVSNCVQLLRHMLCVICCLPTQPAAPLRVSRQAAFFTLLHLICTQLITRLAQCAQHASAIPATYAGRISHPYPATAARWRRRRRCRG